jgi:hypothetical protein
MAKTKTSQHILSTSANLLGFCLFILTSLHLSDINESNIIDEMTAIVALLLTISSGFSFVSIRTAHDQRAEKLERIADFFFLISLVGIFGIVTFLAIHYWHT